MFRFGDDPGRSPSLKAVEWARARSREPPRPRKPACSSRKSDHHAGHDGHDRRCDRATRRAVWAGPGLRGRRHQSLLAGIAVKDGLPVDDADDAAVLDGAYGAFARRRSPARPRARSSARRAAARPPPRRAVRMIQRSVSTWLRGMSRTKFRRSRRPASRRGPPACRAARWRRPHHHDPVAEPERLRQVVRDEDHRLARLLLQADHLVLHVAPDERIERAERLVEEQHLRVERERASKADALLHAARELVRIVLARSPRGRRDRPSARARASRFSLGLALDLEPERDVVEHAPVGEEAEVLEDHRPRCRGPGSRSSVVAAGGDLSARRCAPCRRSAR